MIRVRISKWVRPEDLVERGYKYIADTKYSGGYYTKQVGSYELQVKLGFPSNFRIKDWDDNRTPWILMKFLLSLEEGNAIGDKIKVIDKENGGVSSARNEGIKIANGEYLLFVDPDDSIEYDLLREKVGLIR